MEEQTKYITNIGTEGKFTKYSTSTSFKIIKNIDINKTTAKDVYKHNFTSKGNLLSSHFMIACSSPKNIITLTIEYAPENTPQSPKSDGVYILDKIGVTIRGNRNRRMLLEINFIEPLTSSLLLKPEKSLFFIEKIILTRRRNIVYRDPFTS